MNLPDRFKAALESLVLRITGKYDYAVPYACRVVQQNGDGTLELVPEDGRLGSNQIIPGLDKVPIRYGAPGITATVGAQSRVIVEFENADPSRPVVTAWDLSSPLVMLTLGGGSQANARVGDLVQSGGPQTPVTITVTTPVPAPGFAIATGTPIQGFISFAFGAPDLTGVLGQPLFGAVLTGADKVQS